MYRQVNAMVDISEEQLMLMRAPVWTNYGDAARTATIGAPFIGGRKWCGACVSIARQVCVDSCVVMIDRDNWCHGCEGVSKRFCGVTCYGERLLNNMSYIACYDRVLARCAENACSWCAGPAGSWCESCDLSLGPANALCWKCDDDLKACRLCYAKKYVMKTGRVRVPLDAARQASRVCAHCGLSAILKLSLIHI